MRSVVQIFLDGRWIRAAEFTPAGKPYCATFEYLPEYVFSDAPAPVSFALPVNMNRLGTDGEIGVPPCPPFLLDLVPQGRGREFLVRELGVANMDANDLMLAQHGAYNPIGNLRLDTAVAFFEDRQRHDLEEHTEGFTLDEILARQEAFLEHIWFHAMLSAGTTGVQGAAPKFLLTQNQDGLWFADAALADDKARRHWLVKLPRGKHETDFAVLRNEAAYLRVAQRCGLRITGEPMHENDMLFVPRFDREVTAGSLHRLAQETLASLAAVRGFGIPVSLFDLVAGFLPHVTNPVAEVIEFLKRDVLNLAMRNTDNHARNTSVQRLPDGTVQLTPIYDFAPMFLDRELVVRGCRWRTAEREVTAWADIVDRLALSDAGKEYVMTALRDFAEIVGGLPETMRSCGVDEAVIEHCQRAIETQAERLGKVPGKGRAHGPTP